MSQQSAISIESIFGRDDFDSDWSQEIADITQECASTFGEPVAGYTQILSAAKKQPMSVWFVVADQLVRMQYGKSGGTKWPIRSLRGSMSHTNPATLTLSQEGGSMALAIMALDAHHVPYLERFLRFLTERGLDVT